MAKHPSKALRTVKTVLPCLLLAAAFLALLLFPVPKEEPEAVRVVRVWSVDTFEGGTGSRLAFLKSAARRTEKERRGVYYLVTALTPEGAEEAFQRGEVPDCLSFGVGLSLYAEYALPLPFSAAGGEIGGKTLAVPWCAGGYYLFSHGGSEGEGKTVLSRGGSNLVCVAAALAGIEGEELPSSSAYVRFLSGEYDCLLGTQRDLYRLRARGAEAEVRPLAGYTDLLTYFSVLSAEKREDCLALLFELLSPRTAELLPQIGMSVPPAEGVTVGVFSSGEALSEAERLAREGDIKNLGKFLKNI